VLFSLFLFLPGKQRGTPHQTLPSAINPSTVRHVSWLCTAKHFFPYHGRIKLYSSERTLSINFIINYLLLDSKRSSIRVERRGLSLLSTVSTSPPRKAHRFLLPSLSFNICVCYHEYCCGPQPKPPRPLLVESPLSGQASTT
jgi:hypothetical protein